MENRDWDIWMTTEPQGQFLGRWREILARRWNKLTR